jgi:hypothetical protein
MKRFVLMCFVAIFTLTAHAANAEVLTFDDPDLSSWYTDRFEPSVFETAVFDGDNRLHIGIDGADQQDNSFYNYQGKKRDFNVPVGSYSINADLFVDSAWGDSNVGIWGTTYDNFGEVSGYPIVAWRSGSEIDDGFYAFDYIVGGWLDMVAPNDTGRWYDITMKYTGTSMDYYINDALALSFADDTQNGLLGNIILNSYNFGESYDVYWDNVGVAPVPEPSTFLLMGLPMLGLIGFRKKLFRQE